MKNKLLRESKTTHLPYNKLYVKCKKCNYYLFFVRDYDSYNHRWTCPKCMHNEVYFMRVDEHDE